jgi:hypothetical protein
MARKPDKNKKNPKVNPDLQGFDVRIDSFGEIKSSLDIEKINEFLNRSVDDKKLRDREDLDFIQGKKSAKGKKAPDKPGEEEEDQES